MHFMATREILVYCLMHVHVGERQPKSRSSHAGTHLYMAPEQLDRKDYDQKVDIFALGVILFELSYLCATDSERVKV